MTIIDLNVKDASGNAQRTVTEGGFSDPVPKVEKVDHSTRIHAPISPSKLNYLDVSLGGCPGFKGTGGTNEAAEEGTRLHEILDAMINESVKAGWFIPSTAKFATSASPATLETFLFTRQIKEKWDDETMTLLTACARVIQPFLAGKEKAQVHTELRLDLKNAAGEVEMWGHNDVLIETGKGRAVLIDWKFGFGAVPPAEENRQGLAYAIGCLQRFQHLNTIGVMFVQPRLDSVTKCVYRRTNIQKLVAQVVDIVTSAKMADAAFGTKTVTRQDLNPGDTCRFCARTSYCPGFLGKLPVAVRKIGGLPMPDTLDLEAISSPAQAAVAALWCDFLSDKLPDIKKRCLEIAEINGGSVEYPAQNGFDSVTYRIQKRSIDRTLGEATQIAEALGQWAAPQHILAAATLKIGALHEIVVPAVQAEAAHQGETLSKKAAEARVDDHLESLGLLGRPDGFVKSLRREKQSKTKKEITT